MTRATQIQNANSFLQGIITDGNEFASLDNACRDMLNIEVGLDGVARRRKGLTEGSTRSVTASGGADLVTQSFRWSSAGVSRSLNLAAVQAGEHLLVYGLTETDIDSEYKATVNIATASGSPVVCASRWTFAGGEDGALYIYTGVSKPVRVVYDETSITLTAAVVDIKVRDTWGVPDGLAADEQPTSLTVAHKYNLYNQGWDGATVESYQKRTGGYGTWGATTAYVWADKVQPATPNGYVYYCVAEGTTGGAAPTWPTTIGSTVTDGGVTWMCKEQTLTYPSNSQQWFAAKNSNGDFDPVALAKADFGAGRAPRGRYVYSLYLINRTSKVATAASVTLSSYIGPSCGTVYANRVWYSGFDSDAIEGLSSTLFYSQVLTDAEASSTVHAYENCYSTNDPTAEYQNETLATDGGRIVVPGVGQVFRVETIGLALIIFSSTGVWSLSGVGGAAFSADSFEITRISNAVPIARSAVLKVKEEIHYWAKEGLMRVILGGNLGLYSVENLTEGRYSKGYETILNNFQAGGVVRDLHRPYGYHDPYKDTIEWIGTTKTLTTPAIGTLNKSGVGGGTWYASVYGNGQFVAGGTNGANSIMTSPDGITWTPQVTVTSFTVLCMTYGEGLYVAGGLRNPVSGNTIYTSPDGVTWTVRASAGGFGTAAVVDVAYGQGRFVASSYVGANLIEYSDNGTTGWTIATVPAGSYVYALGYGKGVFVAIATIAGAGRILNSADGITWTAGATLPNVPGPWARIVYGSGVFAIFFIDSGTSHAYVSVSTDGNTWVTNKVLASACNVGSITYGDGLFMVVTDGGTYDKVMTSPDGVNWTTVQTVAADPDSLTGLSYGDGRFVSTATDTTNNYRFLYTDLDMLPSQTLLPYNDTLKFNLKLGAFTKHRYSGAKSIRSMITVDAPGYRSTPHYLIDTLNEDGNGVTLSWGKNVGTDFLDLGLAQPQAYMNTWPQHVGAPHLQKQFGPYVNVYFDRTETNWTAAATFDFPSACNLVAKWDWNTNAAKKQWSNSKNIYRFTPREAVDPGAGYPVAFDPGFDVFKRRIKTRGRGLSVELEFTSSDGMDMQIQGWTTPYKVATDE